MKLNKSQQFALVVLLAVSGMANAQYYGGLNLLPAKPSVFDADTATPVLGLGFFSTDSALAGKDSRYGFRLSYRLTPHLAFDGSAVETGRALGAGSIFSGNGLKARATDLGLVGSLPIFDKFSLLGRAGFSRMRQEGTFNTIGNVDLLSSTGLRMGNTARLGLGMQYDISSSLGLRFEVARQRALGAHAAGSEVDSGSYSFGVSFRF
jgi:OOP family OmpA-OmpF porin